MEESKKKNLQENILQNKIKSYFEKISYGEKYNLDICITILAVLFVVFVVFYLNINSRISLEKINWEKNKCNPFFMPFASTVNDGEFGFNEKNLQNCLNDLTSNIAFDVLSPINALMNLFSEILKFFASMFSQLLAFIMHLFNLLVSLFREMMLRIERIVQENIIIFSKINDFIGKVLGFISLVYYQIVIVVDSIKLIFPIMALSFLVGVVLPALIALIISIILLAVFYVIGVSLSPVFCIGCWAWGPVAVWVIIVIFMMCFFILIVVLYIIFANMCNDILVRILRPVTTDDSNISFKPPPGG